MVFESAPINTLPGSTALEVAAVNLQLLTVAFEVATVSQQPNTKWESPYGRPLCSMVRELSPQPQGVTPPTNQWVLGSHDNKGYAFVNMVFSLESIGRVSWDAPEAT